MSNISKWEMKIFFVVVAYQYSTSNNVQEKIQENSSETIMQYIRQPHIYSTYIQHIFNIQSVIWGR